MNLFDKISNCMTMWGQINLFLDKTMSLEKTSYLKGYSWKEKNAQKIFENQPWGIPSADLNENQLFFKLEISS